MLIRLITIGLGVWIASASLAAQEPKADEDPAHGELRQLRKTLTEAVNKGDVDAILSHCAMDVVFTPTDGQVCRGKQAVRDYFGKMMKGPNKRFESFSTDLEADAVSNLYPGPTAVATGPSKDHYKLTNGMEFTVDSRWSATLIKVDGKWLLVNFQVSCNIFNNPMLNLAKETLFWGAGIAGGGGLLVGLLLGWFLKRRANR